MEVLHLRIEQPTHDRATVVVEEASPATTPPDVWRISVEKPGKGVACESFQVDGGPRRSIDLPVICEEGIEYRVVVRGLRRLGGDGNGVDDLTGGYMVVSAGETSFIPEVQTRSLTDVVLDLTLEQPTFDRTTLLFRSSAVPSIWQVRLSRRQGGDDVTVRLFHIGGTAERFDVPVLLEQEVEYRAEVTGLIQVEGGSGGLSGGTGCLWVVCRESLTFSGGTQSTLNDYLLELELEQTTYREVDLILNTPSSTQAPEFWEVNVNDAGTYQIPGTARKFKVPGLFDAGLTYFIAVRGMLGFSSRRDETEGYVIPWQQSISFKAELTSDDIRILHDKAVAMAIGNRSPEPAPTKRCVWLYRNKSPEYFDEIFTQRSGIMEVILKDNNGDPGSPINSCIRGLFFLASVDRQSNSGQPIPVSPFGSTRVCLPAAELVNPTVNMYFTDFYCVKAENQYHYVTLVICRPGSEADAFCVRRLHKLDLNANPFLFRDSSGELFVTSMEKVLVEVFYTENLDIEAYRDRLVENVPLIGSGSSTHGGIRKSPFCTMCNLYPRKRRGESTV